jgi:peptidoglycan/LPS O-acetylase OafA/YrhL
LSGWLIGGLFWAEQRRFGDVQIGRFLCRRWLRTVPPYLVILPVAWLAVYMSRRQPFEWSYLVFAQNYMTKLAFFNVSWSLCVEEHFYLVLPFLLTLLRLARLPIPWILIALACVPAILREVIVRPDGPITFDYYLMATHFRYEGLALGVLAAWVYQYAPEVWRRWQIVARWLAFPAIALFISMAFWPFHLLHNPGLSIIALIFTTLLVAVAGREPLPLATHPWTYRIALWSYRLYLTHSLTIHACRLVHDRLPAIPWFVELPGWIAALLAAGWIYCELVENTAIRLRDRWAPRRPKLSPASGTNPVELPATERNAAIESTSTSM